MSPGPSAFRRLRPALAYHMVMNQPPSHLLTLKRHFIEKKELVSVKMEKVTSH